MLKISDFSKLSKISIRMLRFYDEKNILKPSIVKDNGYRFYDPKQLFVASHIKYLRYLGFETNQMKNILSIYQDGDDISRFLQVHLSELQDEQATITEKIKALSETIEKLQKEETMVSYQVEIKEIPEKYMMCKRGIVPSYDKEGLLWHGMINELKELKMDIEYPENPLTMAVFFDSGYKENDVDIEIRTEVKGHYQDTENIHFKKIPAVKVASITFTGGYEHSTDVSYCIAEWISNHDYKISGPDFSIYHVGYAQTENSQEFVTEICYPIQ